MSGTAQIVVKSENKQLLLSSNTGAGNAVLAYREPLKFQVNGIYTNKIVVTVEHSLIFIKYCNY